MNQFVLSTENASDLPKKIALERDVQIMNLHFTIGDTDYNGDDIDSHEFYGKLRSGLRSVTSQGNLSDYENFWRPFLDEGKDILHIALSSAISGTYRNACRVAESLKKEYPDRKIFVVDSRGAAPGFGFFMTLIADYRDAGHTVEECHKYAEDTKLKVNYVFTVDDLRTLVSTGRVKSSEAFIGRMLQIKPILLINDMGELKPFWKVVGRKISLKFICDRAKTKFTPETKRVVLGQADCPEDAAFCVEYLKKGLDPSIQVDVWDVGPVIGSHVGPNMMSIFFVSDNRIVKPY